MEWIDGIKMSDVDGLRAAGHDLKAIAANLVQSFLRHTLRDGFFHADMHQGNLFVEADGTIVAVDLGIIGRLGKKERRFLAEILYGFITRDYHRVAEVHFEAGYVPRTHDVDAFAQAIRAIGEPIHGQPAETISMAKLLTLLFEVTELFDMQTRTGTRAAAEDHGGGRGRGAHARSRISTCGRRPSRWSATGSPAISARAVILTTPAKACMRWSALARQAPELAAPHRAAVARDRRDGRAWPAIRREHRPRDRQGRGPRHPLGPRRALGHRACAGLDRLAADLTCIVDCNASNAALPALQAPPM